MVALADRVGASHLATGPLRADRRRRRRARCWPQPPTPAKDQTYMLSGLRAGDPARGFVSRWPSSPSRAVREIAARGGPGRGLQAREPGPLLPGRRGQALVPRSATAASRDRPGEIVDAGGARAGRAPRATTTSRSASAAASASPPASRSTCSATDAAREPRGRRPPRGPGDTTVSRSGAVPAPRLGPRRPRQAALPLPLDRMPAVRGAARASTRSSNWSSPSPPTASRPARPPA